MSRPLLIAMSSRCGISEAVNELVCGPSPSGRGRRDSLIEAGAPGEGRAEREPDRAKPKEKSIQILRPHPALSQRERVDLPQYRLVHSFSASGRAARST